MFGISSTVTTLAIIIVAVVVLIQAGKVVVRSMTALARRFGLSEYVLSFVLLAFATSLPELSVGVNAALAGVPALSLGDIMGTNIVNLTLIMGLVAIIGGSVAVRDYEHFKTNRVFEFAIVLTPLILLLDGYLGRIEAGFLLLLFVWNLFRLLDIDDKILGRKVLRPHLVPATAANARPTLPLYRTVATFVVAVAALVASTFFVVGAGEELARYFGIPDIIIGIVLIATLTSLPELTIGIRGALQARGGLALGDIMGAAAINSTFILAIVALISPIVVSDVRVIWIALGFTAAAFLVLFYFFSTKQSLSRSEGLILVMTYILFIIVQLWSLSQ